MKWMRERDALIAQTMAFVQSVTGKKPEGLGASAAETPVAPVAALVPNIEALLAETPVAAEVPKPAQIVPAQIVPAQIAHPQITRPDKKADFPSEIRDRVASFRAHQERFSREREAYCSATLAKVQESLRELTQPPRIGK